ncbi:MAG: polysaccharide deacetylase family protein [Pseudomonas sp.]|nr:MULTISPECIES: polysaccharide deacetylase family protein [unclassified Pseudomonas]MDE1196247.1 polysaccharide deacetylase family protein [Pseudomonas sp.]
MPLLIGACLLAFNAQAATGEIATMDRSVWPEVLETPQLFDVASRAQIMSFAHQLLESENLSDVQLAERLGLRQINVQTVNVIRTRLWTRLFENWKAAEKSCDADASFCVLVDDVPMLRQRAGEYKVADDSFYARWAAPADAFSQRYLNELLRMAALFPQTSSEVERYNSDELSGEEMPDRTFLLNFESGPTVADGATDWLADFMRQQKINATFFVLGKNLQGRLDASSPQALQTLYRQQCVGLQGWEYRSHAHWNDWQDSVERSAALVQQTLPDNFVPLFRPPYGHRRADSAQFFRDQQLQVSLWNIDSQDATGRITAEQAAHRVLTLMLLWRRGNIVFHDSTDKAQQAIPWLMANTAQSGVIWEDCHIYPQQLSDEADQMQPDDEDSDEPTDEQSEEQPQDSQQQPANQAEEPGNQGE